MTHGMTCLHALPFFHVVIADAEAAAAVVAAAMATATTDTFILQPGMPQIIVPSAEGFPAIEMNMQGQVDPVTVQVVYN